MVKNPRKLSKKVGNKLPPLAANKTVEHSSHLPRGGILKSRPDHSTNCRGGGVDSIESLDVYVYEESLLLLPLLEPRIVQPVPFSLN
jgi:hypothetical protein